MPLIDRMPQPEELILYTGRPRTGKTSLALVHAARFASNGWPILVIDSVGASNLAAWPHADTPQAATDIVYGRQMHVAYTPHGDDEFLLILEGIKGAARAGGRACIVIDEIFRWAYPVPPNGLVDAFQAHRHVVPGTPILYTSQYVGFLRSDLLNCIDVAYIFMTQSFHCLKRLREEYDVDPEAVKALHYPPPPLDYMIWEA